MIQNIKSPWLSWKLTLLISLTMKIKAKSVASLDNTSITPYTIRLFVKKDPATASLQNYIEAIIDRFCDANTWHITCLFSDSQSGSTSIGKYLLASDESIKSLNKNLVTQRSLFCTHSVSMNVPWMTLIHGDVMISPVWLCSWTCLQGIPLKPSNPFLCGLLLPDLDFTSFHNCWPAPD